MVVPGSGCPKMELNTPNKSPETGRTVIYSGQRSSSMAYVPGCSYDLFVSYATENNRDGWVEQFEKMLGRELGELLGPQFSPRGSIFFDRRELEVAQSFPEQLVGAAR